MLLGMSLGMAGNYLIREPFANHELAMFYDLRGQTQRDLKVPRLMTFGILQPERSQIAARMQLEC